MRGGKKWWRRRERVRAPGEMAERDQKTKEKDGSRSENACPGVTRRGEQ